MKPAPTIVAELEEYLGRESLSVSQFAERSGIHSGTLSNMIHGRRPIAMQQLDRITGVMGLAEGFYYNMYIDNYIIDGSPDWRRVGPLLHRCAELGRLDAIQRVVQIISDNPIYLPALFETAEELYTQGKLESSSLLYEFVAESEKYQHSERLALCQYRLFSLRSSDDQNANLLAAIYFEPYLERLDESYQLDALHELINMNISLHRWHKTEELARKMRNKASLRYRHSSRRAGGQEELRKPLIFYIFYSYLIQANAWRECGDYEKALHFIAMYDAAEWVKEPDEEEQRIIRQFSEWAESNRYMYRLMAGQTEVLPDYLSYIAGRPDEIFPALCVIVAAANKYQLNIDPILEDFRAYLTLDEQHIRSGQMSDQVSLDRYTRFLNELDTYSRRTT